MESKLTPKEQAEKMFKFYVDLADELLYETWHLDNYHKACALFTATEILNSCQDQSIEGYEWRTYWREVKKEIEKL